MHHLSTGHIAELDLTAMTLTLHGPTETMDAIPQSELDAILAPHGLTIADAIDETTYALA